MLDIQNDEPFVSGSWKHLLNGLNWMREFKLKGIIDLHGAPESQNGNDHSGQRGEVKWPCCNLKNINRTISVLGSLGSYFSEPLWKDVVHGINLINEPFPVSMPILKQFYIDSYNKIRRASGNNNLSITISDGFQGLNPFIGFMQPPRFENVYFDTHHYQVFDHGMLRWSYEQHLDFVCKIKKEEIRRMNANLWTYVGEFSLATTDCTKWLNGIGRGARFDGTFGNQPRIGSCVNSTEVRSFTPEYRQFLKKFIEAQLDAYESSTGWFFWTAKTEKSPQWDYMQGVREGWIPRNPGNRTYKC